MVLRIRFNKHGSVRYIGHLDVMRFFQKAVRRAGIDVKYTSGFSPHQVMSFAQPLSVGHESNGEYMDIEVLSFSSCEDIMRRLNEASVPGIQVMSVRVLPEKAPNAMASVAAARYTVFFKNGKVPEFMKESSFHPDAAILQFMDKKEILITKEGKSGLREVDIRQGIYEFCWEKDHFCMLLDASSGGNIKPVQVIDALCREYGDELEDHALFVTREDTYTGSASGGFLSLGEIGEIM